MTAAMESPHAAHKGASALKGDGEKQLRKRGVTSSAAAAQQPRKVDADKAECTPQPASSVPTAAAMSLRQRASAVALSLVARAFAALFPSVQYVALPSDATTLQSSDERPASLRLYGEEYDVSTFAARHPGGSLVLQQVLGQDCTDVFAVYHPPQLVQQARDIAAGQPVKGMLAPLHRAKASNPAVKAAERTAMQRDFDDIVRQLEREGKFAPTPGYYLLKAAIFAAVLASAVALILLANHHTAQLTATAARPLLPALVNGTATYTTSSAPSLSIPSAPTSVLSSLLAALVPSYAFVLYSLSAVLLGMFWQQLAFIGHDAGHSQLTGSARGDYGYAWLVTCFFGVSGSWWKRNHNVHHVHTNSIECDPDIQHLPMLAVSEDILKGFYSTYHQKAFTFDRVAQAFVRYQHLLYYPLMGIARANLYVQSLLLVLNPNAKVPHRRAELLALLVYWCWFVALMRLLPASHALRFWYYMLSHAVGGLVHVQITLSHFAMPAYHGPSMPDTVPASSTTPHDQHAHIHGCAVDATANTIRYEAVSEADLFFHTQFTTTMNVDCPRWMDWLHGGLQFQVEHHLLPRLPRKHLRYAMQQHIKPFAAKHGLPYHAYSFAQCNRLVYDQLKRQAAVMGKYVEGEAAARKKGSEEGSMLWQGMMAQG